MSKIDQGIRY